MRTADPPDVEAGRESELDSLVGVVVRLGAELGVPTPVMTFAYAALKPGQIEALKDIRTETQSLKRFGKRNE